MLSSIKRTLKNYLVFNKIKKEAKNYPKVVAVDEHDQLIGHFDLYEALQRKYIRRISAVFVFNVDGEILLQKRTTHVLSPNTWDFSAAGHVNEGETYEEAAKKELREELRLTAALTEVATSLPVPGLFFGVYKTMVKDSTQIDFNRDEVQDIRWISIEEMEREMKEKPETYCQMGIYNFWSLHRDKIVAT